MKFNIEIGRWEIIDGFEFHRNSENIAKLYQYRMNEIENDTCGVWATQKHRIGPHLLQTLCVKTSSTKHELIFIYLLLLR